MSYEAANNRMRNSEYRATCRQELKAGCSTRIQPSSLRRNILRVTLAMREPFTVGALMQILEKDNWDDYGLVTRLVRLLSENGALTCSVNENGIKVYEVIR